VTSDPIDVSERSSEVDAGASEAPRADDAAPGASDVEPRAATVDGEQKCAGIRQDAPVASGGTDVIILLDTSGSMLHATTQVASNMASFVQNFEGIYNTRFIVITALDPAAGSDVALDSDRYRFIPAMVDSKQLFSTALARFPQYQDFLRSDASTQFVMITDDDDFMAPADFSEQMEQQLGHTFVQHAIASEDVNGFPCTSEAQKWDPLCIAPIPAICAAMAIGKAYYELADETGGIKQSICKDDWSDVFELLRAAVIAAVPLPCSYPLVAAGQHDFDPDKVQILYTPGSGVDVEFGKAETVAKCADERAWYYDDNAAPTSIELCPAACSTVASGGTLDVAFGCPPLVVR
jgi:hypothetical protein